MPDVEASPPMSHGVHYDDCERRNGQCIVCFCHNLSIYESIDQLFLQRAETLAQRNFSSILFLSEFALILSMIGMSLSTVMLQRFPWGRVLLDRRPRADL